MDKTKDLQSILARGEAALNEGRFDDMRAACDAAFAIDPGALAALWLYTHGTLFTPGDGVLARLEGFATAKGIADPIRAQVMFMLGKAYGDMGRVAEAFEAIVTANALSDKSVNDDGLDKLTGALIAAVKSAPVLTLPKGGPRMVFVLGMPRSGTSLISQMLGAHSEVSNLGERLALGPALSRNVEGRNPHLAFLDGLDLPRLEAARARYLDGLPETGILIDKMPENYWFAWAIPMLFPDALIIHMRRERLATLWSCFRNDFREGHRYSYDWTSLSKQYDRHVAMCRLGAARAADRWFELSLDYLTQDPRGTLTPVLGALGLDWEDTIAAPEQAGGTMPTLSKWQVRQGIDPKISGGWRAYLPLIREHLEPRAP